MVVEAEGMADCAPLDLKQPVNIPLKEGLRAKMPWCFGQTVYKIVRSRDNGSPKSGGNRLIRYVTAWRSGHHVPPGVRVRSLRENPEQAWVSYEFREAIASLLARFLPQRPNPRNVDI
jgi:hypothetical protein